MLHVPCTQFGGALCNRRSGWSTRARSPAPRSLDLAARLGLSADANKGELVVPRICARLEVTSSTAKPRPWGHRPRRGIRLCNSRTSPPVELRIHEALWSARWMLAVGPWPLGD